MDGIDIQLVSMLQGSGRVSQNDMAHAVGLSAPAVAERVRKLEDRGVILKYTAIVDPRAIGLDVTAFVAVIINGSRYYASFAKNLARQPEILECHSVTGMGSHLLKVRTESTASLERLLSRIQSWAGVQSTTTSVVLSTIKEIVGAPLDELAKDLSEGRDDTNGASTLLHVPFRNNP